MAEPPVTAETAVTRIALVALIVFLGVGCATPGSSPTNYYLLELDETAIEGMRGSGSEAGSGSEPAGSVIVAEAEIAPIVDRRQVVQRREGPVVRYLSSHLWAVSPPRALGELVRDGVDRLGFFEEVTAGREARGSYEVKTRIDSLTHHCCESGITAKVAGEFTLVEAESGEVLLRHEFSRSRDLSDEEVRTFVEGVSEVLSEELASFLADVPTAASRDAAH
ncbi:MAG: ABC-type transport auxiliary lipoprotein family protein [Spirochaetota bacterium]